MSTYSQDQFKEILSKHALWLINAETGKRADLRGANLHGADLRYADLRYADLRYADLRGADLRYANLRYANLRGADLRDADLRGADLRYANLRYANLHGANLRGANLRGADLRGADLRGADLRDAMIYDGIKLKETAPILTLGLLGSRNDILFVFNTDHGIYLRTGCFDGTMHEFLTAVTNQHGNNKHARDYTNAVAFARGVLES